MSVIMMLLSILNILDRLIHRDFHFLIRTVLHITTVRNRYSKGGRRRGERAHRSKWRSLLFKITEEHYLQRDDY